MRELAAQGLLIVLIAIGFGAIANVIYMLFAGRRPVPESASHSFWSVFIERSKGHVLTQLVLFALMIVVFIALGLLKQHPAALSH